MFFPFIRKNSYKTLNLIEISKSALQENFNYFQKINPQARICPVLKSNAYGHGLKLIGKFVDQIIKPEFICVDSLFEAYELETIDIKSKILIMGYTFPENFCHRRINFRLPLFDIETLKFLSKYQKNAKVHLKIDTGMNRLGIKEYEVDTFIGYLKKFSNISVEGIYSHLADAENNNENFSIQQNEVFKRIIKRFEKAGFLFKYKHLYSTAGALRFHDPEYNLIRLGLGFYGLGADEIKPALSLKTHIASLKELEKNETVSYERTFIAKKKIKIAILPLGYYDGIDRRLSNKGIVKIAGENCSILGNVCMNITMVDVSAVKNPYVGQEVVVYDNKQSSKNSIMETAKICKTIPYEILVKLSETTRRVLI